MLLNARSYTFSICTALFYVFVLQNEASAITTYTVNATCPLDGKLTKEMRYGSYNFNGRRLDTKAILLGSPQVLPFPVCKEDGFVIYKKSFKPEELEKARSLVETAEFRLASKIHTNHYLAAIEAEFLGESQFVIGHLYLTASWESEESRFGARNNVTIQTLEYIAKSLLHFSNYLESHNNRDDRWWFAQLISANIERKLAKFQDAIARINTLPLDKVGKKSRAYLTAVKILQLAKQKNLAPGKL
jgi:hypothetical protein